MTNNTTPCNILVLPVAKDNIMVKRDSSKSTVAFMSMPKVMVIPVKIATMATAGMVKPILAKAEPKAKFKLVCSLFFFAAL